MNATAIESAARQISALSAALQWMRENGNQALNPADKDAFGVNVALNSCSALPGAKEAAAQLSACARHFGPQILAAAIKDAESTIEILRDRIAREVATA